jgi:5-methyltetrahydrofolate--homocysteine methyltransferase
MAELFQDIASGVYNGEADTVTTLVTKAVDEGIDAQEVLSNGLIAGMDEVGKDFKAGELFVPEVLIAARAMHAGMDILRPLLAESGVPTAGKCIIGTVQGDLHDIGKNLVRMMLEGAGYEIVDLGTDVNAEDFVAAVREHQPQILGLSALLTTTMVTMKATIEALDEAGVRDSVKIVIGGAPVTAAFADEIRADGYAPDAASAVDLVRELTR